MLEQLCNQHGQIKQLNTQCSRFDIDTAYFQPLDYTDLNLKHTVDLKHETGSPLDLNSGTGFGFGALRQGLAPLNAERHPIPHEP